MREIDLIDAQAAIHPADHPQDAEVVEPEIVPGSPREEGIAEGTKRSKERFVALVVEPHALDVRKEEQAALDVPAQKVEQQLLVTRYELA